MPTNKQVVDLIEKWSGKRPDSMDQSLEEWWNSTAPGSSHSALDFDPDGISDLVKKVTNAFPPPPTIVAADFKSAGTIKTVQDLVDALQAPVSAAATREEDSVDTVRPISMTKRAKKKAGPRTGSRKTRKGKTTGKKATGSKKVPGRQSKKPGSGKGRNK